jgi:hypothetical protein
MKLLSSGGMMCRTPCGMMTLSMGTEVSAKVGG